MRKIINDKMYNTDTAKTIASYSVNSVGDFGYLEETLYKKKTGEFFLYGYGGAYTKYAHVEGNNRGSSETIKPLSEKEAKEWLADNDFVDAYIKLFGEVDE